MIAFRTLTDADELQALFDRSLEFFELTEGAPGDARLELALRAPDRSDDETYCFGVDVDDRLAAFVHLTRNYPKPDEWWLGLLLLDPAVRGAGLGVAVHDAILAFARERGATVMWLGVLEQNPRAHRFWLARGYAEQERQTWTSPAGLQSMMVLMRQSLE